MIRKTERGRTVPGIGIRAVATQRSTRIAVDVPADARRRRNSLTPIYVAQLAARDRRFDESCAVAVTLTLVALPEVLLAQFTDGRTRMPPLQAVDRGRRRARLLDDDGGG